MAQHREIFLSTGLPDTPFERFVYAVEHARRRYPSMTLGAFATFLSIARHHRAERITATALGEELDLPLPTIFRQCNQLADGLPGKPGMGLIKKVGDADDARLRQLSLTLGGMGLVAEIASILSVEF
jgi:DNA-binding MarR family transcriptional regulator